MTQSEPQPQNRATRRRWRRAAVAAGVVLVVGGAAGAGVYLMRRTIARDLLIGWLEQRGVPAEVEFKTFEFGGFTARVRAGPKARPDVSVEQVEVLYGVTGPWAGRPFGVEAALVRLDRPKLRAAFRDGKLSVGSLDRVIAEFARRPPQPDARQPRIEVRGGSVRLDTDYGPLNVHADGRMEDGRLMALEARVDPARLAGKAGLVELGPATLRQATTGRRVDLVAVAPIKALRSDRMQMEAGVFRLSLQGPYPDPARRRADEPLTLHVEATAATAKLGADNARDLRLTADFQGAMSGWDHTLALMGDGAVSGSAGGGRFGGFEVRALRADATLGDVRWTRSAGDVVSAELSSRIAADRVSGPDLVLTDARSDLAGMVAFDPKRMDVALRGAVASRGAWSGLGAVADADAPETAALKRALAGFRVNANSVAVNLSDGGLAVDLGAPVRVVTDTGGEALLYRSGGPVYANGAGRFGMTVGKGGLPDIDLDVRRYRLTSDGLDAALSVKASGGFAPVSEASLDAAGALRIVGGAVSFQADRCIPLAAGRVDLGETDLRGLVADICPSAGAPMLHLTGGAWRAVGRVSGLSVEVPTADVRVRDGAGLVALSGTGARIDGRVMLDRAQVADTAAEHRFHPVVVSGAARATRGEWTGEFALTDRAGRGLGRGTLAQRPNGVGGLRFDTGALTIAPDGVQPLDLSPLASLIGSPAAGRARFVGDIAWGRGDLSSRGSLDVERLDFISPMGPVHGLAGRIEFDSLLPLKTAPGQRLSAESIDTLTPLTQVDVRFGLAPDAVSVDGAQFEIGGGKLIFEPFTLPFAPDTPWRGVLRVEAVQISDLVEASPFGDRVDLDARLSGRLPFEVGPDGVRIRGGVLRAIQPGRLSIQREALTPVASAGGDAKLTAPGAPGEGVLAESLNPAPTASGEVNAFSEFAYQAMEDMAFETLEASVDSQADGRLGILMHLNGEHKPPKHQEIRLTLWDLVKRDFLNRPLPLPSGTKVDLTLDTSLNLDQILRDFTEFQALRGSHTVQP